jgi:hypothetical protein
MRQPTPWSCLPTAFAMTSGVSMKEILEVIGHDGSEICWPDLEEPFCRRGFCVQEIVVAGLILGFSVMNIVPTLKRSNYHQIKRAAKESCKHFQMIFEQYDGIIIKQGHALAKVNGIIIDPFDKTKIKDFDQKDLICFLVVLKN